MGTIVDSRNFINDNAELLVEQQGQLSRFLDVNKRIYATYFNICTLASNTSHGYGQVDSIDNQINNPYRYKKINNMVLAGANKVDINFSFDDQVGFDTRASSEAVILPNTITPNVDDLLQIEYMNSKYLFKVTEFSRDHLIDNNYFRITFKLFKILAEGELPVLESSIVEEFIMEFDSEQTDQYYILTKNEYNIAEVIQDLYNDMKSKYTKKYYNEIVNTFMFPMGSNYLYDANLINFIIENKLFEDKISYDSFYPDMEIIVNPDEFYIKYYETIYGAFEKKAKNSINYVKYQKKLINKRGTIFEKLGRPIEFMDYIPNEVITDVTVLDVQVIANIVSGTLFPYKCVENLFVKFFNNMEFKVEDLDPIKDYGSKVTLKDYILTPIIIYILKSIIISIIEKNS